MCALTLCSSSPMSPLHRSSSSVHVTVQTSRSAGVHRRLAAELVARAALDQSRSETRCTAPFLAGRLSRSRSACSRVRRSAMTSPTQLHRPVSLDSARIRRLWWRSHGTIYRSTRLSAATAAPQCPFLRMLSVPESRKGWKHARHHFLQLRALPVLLAEEVCASASAAEVGPRLRPLVAAGAAKGLHRDPCISASGFVLDAVVSLLDH